jgi:hypothetical protein
LRINEPIDANDQVIDPLYAGLFAVIIELNRFLEPKPKIGQRSVVKKREEHSVIEVGNVCASL